MRFLHFQAGFVSLHANLHSVFSLSSLLVVFLANVNVQRVQHSQLVWEPDSGNVWIHVDNNPIFIVMLDPFSPIFLVSKAILND